MADTHNIHSNCRLLPDHIVCKITQRNNIRRANTCDPGIKLLNEEITSDIQKHKENIWKEHLDADWDHIHHTHILWKTIHGISNKAPPPTVNTYITFSTKIATTPKHIANCLTLTHTTHTSIQLHPHTYHIVTLGSVDRPRRSDCTAGQMDGEAGWWTTSKGHRSR